MVGPHSSVLGRLISSNTQSGYFPSWWEAYRIPWVSGSSSLLIPVYPDLVALHSGGKAESIHTNHGQHETHLASDQLADDKSVRALLRTYQMKKPLVVLVDDKYALFPFNLAEKECTYAILGWYRIAYAWGMLSSLILDGTNNSYNIHSREATKPRRMRRQVQVRLSMV